MLLDVAAERQSLPQAPARRVAREDSGQGGGGGLGCVLGGWMAIRCVLGGWVLGLVFVVGWAACREGLPWSLGKTGVAPRGRPGPGGEERAPRVHLRPVSGGPVEGEFVVVIWANASI